METKVKVWLKPEGCEEPVELEAEIVSRKNDEMLINMVRVAGGVVPAAEVGDRMVAVARWRQNKWELPVYEPGDSAWVEINAYVNDLCEYRVSYVSSKGGCCDVITEIDVFGENDAVALYKILAKAGYEKIEWERLSDQTTIKK